MNPFDDGSHCGGGGNVARSSHNPFDDESERDGDNTAPSGYNPFDSDEDSELKTTEEKERESDDVQKSQQLETLAQRPIRSEKSSMNVNSGSSNNYDRGSESFKDDCNSQLSTESQSDKNLNREDHESNSNRVLSCINSLDNTDHDSLEGSDYRMNNSKRCEKESSAAVTDASSNNISKRMDSDDRDGSNSSPDENLSDDEEAQQLQQAARVNDKEAGDEHGDKLETIEAANEYNDSGGEGFRHKPQSTLCADEPADMNNTQSDKSKEEGETPQFQNKDNSSWDKEGISAAVASFNAKCAQDFNSDIDAENPVQERSSTREPKVKRSSVQRKKVKHRYCKACIMVTVVWVTMIILLSVALGMDWIGIHFDETKSESLCTLCDESSGIAFNVSEFTRRPTRKPSSTSSSLFVDVATIKPPPENMAELCAPSILLDHGSTEISVEKITACATACLPAACCVSQNDEAREALTATFESQGMGVQAATLFSTIEGCNSGDNVAVCDSYNNYCSTLYDIDYALDSLPKNIQQACNDEDEITPTATATSRQYHSERCKDACFPLSCCYETVDSTYRTEWKRKRQHVSYTNSARRTIELRQNSGSGCDSFMAPTGSLNAQICNAYSAFCKPTSSMIHTSTPSYQSSMQTNHQRTYSPTIRLGSDLSPAPSVGSPSSHPTITFAPKSSYPSYSTSSTNPSLSSTTNMTSATQSSYQPTISLIPTLNASEPTSFSSLPNEQPPSTSLPTSEVNGTLEYSYLPTNPSSENGTNNERNNESTFVLNSTSF